MSIHGFPYDMLYEWPPSIFYDALPIIQGLLYAIWDSCIQGGGGCNHGPPNGLALGFGCVTAATAACPTVVCAIILGCFCAKPEDPSSAMKPFSSDSMSRPLSACRTKSDIAEKKIDREEAPCVLYNQRQASKNCIQILR
jgi:hypothetical protein